MSAVPRPVTIGIGDGERVSGLLLTPPEARACYVMAHGAGAGMAHPFMVSVANHLAEGGIATFRYQFPYMERGSKRPDSLKVATAAVRAAAQAGVGAGMLRLRPWRRRRDDPRVHGTGRGRAL